MKNKLYKMVQTATNRGAMNIKWLFIPANKCLHCKWTEYGQLLTSGPDKVNTFKPKGENQNQQEGKVHEKVKNTREKWRRKQFADKIIEQFRKHEFRQSTDTFSCPIRRGKEPPGKGFRNGMVWCGMGACGLVKIDMTSRSEVSGTVGHRKHPHPW